MGLSDGQVLYANIYIQVYIHMCARVYVCFIKKSLNTAEISKLAQCTEYCMGNGSALHKPVCAV